MKIRVLLVEDHNIVRQGLQLVLAGAPDIEVVGEAENGAEAVRMARQLQPDVILLDIMMPVENGIDAARKLGTGVPKSKVIVLSSYSDEDRVRELLQFGVAGYLVKQTASIELLDAIRQVRRGNSYFSPSISRSLVEQGRTCVSTQTFKPRKKQNLTPREKQVLVLIAQGSPNKAIASDLAISIKTVEKHRQQVMNKLDIHEAAGLTRYALSTRIVENTVTRAAPVGVVL